MVRLDSMVRLLVTLSDNATELIRMLARSHDAATDFALQRSETARRNPSKAQKGLLFIVVVATVGRLFMLRCEEVGGVDQCCQTPHPMLAPSGEGVG
jgi:hypothetical protein